MATELRLANGSTRCEGRVEITHDGTWAPLCDEGWGLAEARVVCRQLGCGRVLLAPGGSHFGQGPGQMWPDSVSCMGTETALSACKAKPWSNGTCHHGRAAGVACAGNPLGSDTAREVVGLWSLTLIFHFCKQPWTTCPFCGHCHRRVSWGIWAAGGILGVLLEGLVLMPVGGMLLRRSLQPLTP
ncbi:scavenger receptor cysteine-rich domain-containing protein DMBT1-like [Morphnus guianensis]